LHLAPAQPFQLFLWDSGYDASVVAVSSSCVTFVAPGGGVSL
jgi:hypothetical protein